MGWSGHKRTFACKPCKTARRERGWRLGGKGNPHCPKCGKAMGALRYGQIPPVKDNAGWASLPLVGEPL
jgi:hypothetical protein